MIDSSLSGALTDYLDHLRKHVARLAQNGAIEDFLAREEGHAYDSLNNTAAASEAASSVVNAKK